MCAGQPEVGAAALCKEIATKLDTPYQKIGIPKFLCSAALTIPRDFAAVGLQTTGLVGEFFIGLSEAKATSLCWVRACFLLDFGKWLLRKLMYSNKTNEEVYTDAG